MKRKRIAFVHPDLGIGGAERLVVDAACALQSHKHFEVTVFTAHHDPSHCFPETKNGTFKVIVRGDWLPKSICGKFVVLCACVRCIWVCFCLLFYHFDFIFVDQVSSCIPVLLFKPWAILFYCHFPDLKLTTRKTFLKRLYRMPIDFIEQITTGMADKVVVNSKYTKQVYLQTFTLLRTHPDVVYPTVKLSVRKKGEKIKMRRPTFVSINRFERKKNIKLAIEALHYVIVHQEQSCQLIIAGGYDRQLPENVEHFEELRELAKSLGLKVSTFPQKGGDLVFLPNFTDQQKIGLFQCAKAVLYTPHNEHFGIVPVEAMHAGVPVIAVRSGGPKETIEDGQTGFLCENTKEAFGDAICKFLDNPELSRQLGKNGKVRVANLFSNDKFKKRLIALVADMLDQGTNRTPFKLSLLVVFLSIIFVFLCINY